MTLKAFSSIINSWKEKLTSLEEDFEGSFRHRAGRRKREVLVL